MLFIIQKHSELLPSNATMGFSQFQHHPWCLLRYLYVGGKVCIIILSAVCLNNAWFYAYVQCTFWVCLCMHNLCAQKYCVYARKLHVIGVCMGIPYSSGKRDAAGYLVSLNFLSLYNILEKVHPPVATILLLPVSLGEYPPRRRTVRISVSIGWTLLVDEHWKGEG